MRLSTSSIYDCLEIIWKSAFGANIFWSCLHTAIGVVFTTSWTTAIRDSPFIIGLSAFLAIKVHLFSPYLNCLDIPSNVIGFSQWLTAYCRKILIVLLTVFIRSSHFREFCRGMNIHSLGDNNCLLNRPLCMPHKKSVELMLLLIQGSAKPSRNKCKNPRHTARADAT